MKSLVILLLSSLGLIAQPVHLKTILYDYPSNELASVFFWIEAKTDLTNEWSTIAIIDLGSTNPMCFYRVGVDWRINAPDWITNFQFIELQYNPPLALTKSKTAGSKTGKLVIIRPKRKTYTIIQPSPPAPSKP